VAAVLDAYPRLPALAGQCALLVNELVDVAALLATVLQRVAQGAGSGQLGSECRRWCVQLRDAFMPRSQRAGASDRTPW
jgi:hypothetical protein